MQGEQEMQEVQEVQEVREPEAIIACMNQGREPRHIVKSFGPGHALPAPDRESIPRKKRVPLFTSPSDLKRESSLAKGATVSLISLGAAFPGLSSKIS